MAILPGRLIPRAFPACTPPGYTHRRDGDVVHICYGSEDIVATLRPAAFPKTGLGRTYYDALVRIFRMDVERRGGHWLRSKRRNTP
jgi:hypothetical protein